MNQERKKKKEKQNARKHKRKSKENSKRKERKTQENIWFFVVVFFLIL